MGCDCPLCARRARLRRPTSPAAARALRALRRRHLRAIVAFDYEPPGVALIGQLKTRLRLSLALVLARLLGAAVARAAPLPADAVLAAVPASRPRCVGAA